MANRQALRELQTRLAERLQAARSNAEQGASWLAVQVAGRHYLLPLDQAGEIFAWPGVQRVPYTHDWFWGVANLRGSLVGVVDLGAYLGHAVARTEQSLHEVSVLAVNPALQVNVALVVDRLMGLRSAEQLQALSAPPEAPNLPSHVAAVLGNSYTDSAGQWWQVLHVQQLVQSPDFLSIRI